MDHQKETRTRPKFFRVLVRDFLLPEKRERALAGMFPDGSFCAEISRKHLTNRDIFGKIQM